MNHQKITNQEFDVTLESLLFNQLVTGCLLPNGLYYYACNDNSMQLQRDIPNEAAFIMMIVQKMQYWIVKTQGQIKLYIDESLNFRPQVLTDVSQIEALQAHFSSLAEFVSTPTVNIGNRVDINPYDIFIFSDLLCDGLIKNPNYELAQNLLKELFFPCLRREDKLEQHEVVTVTCSCLTKAMIGFYFDWKESHYYLIFRQLFSQLLHTRNVELPLQYGYNEPYNKFSEPMVEIDIALNKVGLTSYSVETGGDDFGFLVFKAEHFQRVQQLARALGFHYYDSETDHWY